MQMSPQSIKAIIVRDRLTYSILRLFSLSSKGLPRGSTDTGERLSKAYYGWGELFPGTGTGMMLPSPQCAHCHWSQTSPAGWGQGIQVIAEGFSILQFNFSLTSYFFFSVIIGSEMKRSALFNLHFTF